MPVKRPFGFLPTLAASLALLAVASGGSPAEAADIIFGANPLSDTTAYFQREAEAAGDTFETFEKRENYDRFVENMLTEGFLDIHSDCSTYMTMLATGGAYFIRGLIRKGDAFALAALMEQQKPHHEEFACQEPIFIESDGGDLLEAIKIGRLIATESRAVIVAPGKRCLSSCVLILMAGRYRDDGFFVPMSFAFEDSVIGVHSPFLGIFSGLGKQDQARALQANPQGYFSKVGDAWRSLATYIVEITHSDFYVSAVLSEGGAIPDHFYIISSPTEAALAGLNILPYRQRQLPAPISREAAFQACLLRFADEKARRLDEVSAHSRFIGDVLIAYYPYEGKICLLEAGAKTTRIVSGTYAPQSIGLDDDLFLATQPLEPTKCVGTVKLAEKDRDRIVGLLTKRHVIAKADLTADGFGVAVDDQDNEKRIVTDIFDLFAIAQGASRFINAEGGYRGRYMFARQGEPPLDLTGMLGDGELAIPELDGHFAKGEAVAGDQPDIVIGNYIFAKLVFDLLDQGCITEFGFGTKAQLETLAGDRPVLVGPTCGNSYGVCSPVLGENKDGNLRLVTSH